MSIDNLRPPTSEKTPELDKNELKDYTAEIGKLMEENGFRLVIPDRSEKFEGTTSYEGLEGLPNFKKKIDKAVTTCRDFLDKGVLIFDDFGNDSVARRAAQARVQEGIRRLAEGDVRDTDEKVEEEVARALKRYETLRDDNLLSSGTHQQYMTYYVIGVLGNGLTDDDTPQAKRVCEIMGTFPTIGKRSDGTYTLSDPKFQWMVDIIENMEIWRNEEIITTSTPYRAMTVEQKLEIVHLYDSIARDFLRLVIKPNVGENK